MFKRLLLRLALYIHGIRFYKTDIIPKSPEFKKAIFKTIGNHTVEFYFYKETGEDLIFKRGAISKETFIGYVIQAKFDEVFPEALYKYNNLKFFFNSNSIILKGNDDIIADALLSIYLDFIKQELLSERL